MSDIMRPMPFAHLMNWILSEYRAQGSVFGVSKLVRHADGKALPIFEEKIESPYGPAAGPHTQLAQNIIAAYAAGSRFFEVKTVQVMDGEELSKCVSKPCITAADECYNCEWSTELYVPQAFAEYVKAWFACKLLAKELELGDPDGFVFNMSVGYDLKGIQSPKVDAYIEGMKDASGTEVWRECMDWALANLDRFEKVDEAYVRGITPHVSNSITESTLHGCPPDEIERIATYLITEKNLNTYVKCNPTLLGYEFARKTLDGLGYDYIQFDDHHFREDLQWEDAVPMFHRLMQRTGERGLEFGVKITNTFPVDVAAGELPSEEMYMSGRSLYPLSLSLAARLAREFKGKLRISYSGGADVHSVRALFDAGIWPITMATTVLKPGGYQRFSQIGQALADISYEPWEGVDAAGAAALAEGISADGHYQKPMKPIPSRKLDKKVPLIDCFSAPCRSGCPIEQDIPAYLMKVGEGKYEEALRIITQRNALPFITGTICSHRCQDKCMRNAYDESVYIRAQKLKAAEGGFEALLPKLRPAAPAAGRRVAVVGGGPGGMSAAYFLSRSGVDVTVFERRDALGGIVRHVIPAFRIPGEAIDNDVRLMEAMGVKVELNTEVKDVQELFAQGFTHVILATGAWQKGSAGLEYGEEHNVIEFLEAAKKAPDTLNLGRHVVVIGGGNTAMDAARAALRAGAKSSTLVYRRTKKYMPADAEELEMAIADGVEFLELVAPVEQKDGKLICEKMKLGDPDDKGRRKPVPTGEMVEIPCDTVVSAVGEKVESEVFTRNGITVDEKGIPAFKTNLEGVYAGGDAMRGPATVVEGIADAQYFANAVIGEAHKFAIPAKAVATREEAVAKKGVLCESAKCEGNRCLTCNVVCQVCADVCPNRANVVIELPDGRQQILHVDRMCNECGNCAVFCPYDSAPYREKFTLFLTREGFDESVNNQGFLPLGGKKVLVRLDSKVFEADLDAKNDLPADIEVFIWTVLTKYAYLMG